jgi:AcrR family transcriptional regulator
MIAHNDPLLARFTAADDYSDTSTQRILDAALTLFGEFGLRRTTMEDVGKRAGLSRVTVWRRFDSKNRLVEAVIFREVRRFFGVCNAAIAPLPSFEDRVVEGFVVSLRFARDSSLLGRLLDLEPETLLPFLTVNGGPILATARSFLAGQFRQAQKAGEAPKFDADAVAETVVRLVFSFVLTTDSCIRLDDERAMRAYARDHIVPLVTRSAAAESGPSRRLGTH